MLSLMCQEIKSPKDVAERIEIDSERNELVYYKTSTFYLCPKDQYENG